ncbi:MAG: tRNA pseudouridine(65) synthase TruC [Gammaproteobacteria bacterium]|nr:tRNA pseudouridine(65) synthase TruC [Gammaproteobacteria bacterium]
MSDDALEILYRNDGIVAINKPHGLLVHRSDIDRHETRFALQLLRDQLNMKVYPLHRLDKPTSGVLLFALEPELARRMMNQFESGSIQKTYLALVRGYCDAQGDIDYALKEETDRMTDSRARRDKSAQDAFTHYRCLRRTELPIAVGRYPTARYSLLEVCPRTGRKHQIRRHMKHIFHPIVGDTTHGDGKHNRMLREHFGLNRLMLHAWRMQLTHPQTGEDLVISAKPDIGFSQMLDSLGCTNHSFASTDDQPILDANHAY